MTLCFYTTVYTTEVNRTRGYEETGIIGSLFDLPFTENDSWDRDPNRRSPKKLLCSTARCGVREPLYRGVPDLAKVLVVCYRGYLGKGQPEALETLKFPLIRR
jgi:hypothetical protein